jgi:hypothetical protein
MDIITTLAIQLAQLRQHKDQLKSDLAPVMERLAANQDFIDLGNIQGQVKATSQQIDSLEASLRLAALEHAKQTGERKHLAYTVGNYKTASYDRDKAVEWCFNHYREGLKLDEKAFEKAAEVLKPEFVTFDTEERAKISSDLSVFLDTQEEPAQAPVTAQGEATLPF